MTNKPTHTPTPFEKHNRDLKSHFKNHNSDRKDCEFCRTIINMEVKSNE